MQQIIFFQQKTLRMAGSQDQPLFCFEDACDMLRLKKYLDVMKHLPEDEMASIVVDTFGAPQKMVFVNEPGFYRLVFMSKSPEAEPIKLKVFNEILPAWRKMGYYRSAGPEAPPALFSLPTGRRDEVLERLEICEEIRASRRVTTALKEISARHKGRRGFSTETLRRWYYHWLNSGCDVLALVSYRDIYKV